MQTKLPPAKRIFFHKHHIMPILLVSKKHFVCVCLILSMIRQRMEASRKEKTGCWKEICDAGWLPTTALLCCPRSSSLRGKKSEWDASILRNDDGKISSGPSAAFLGGGGQSGWWWACLVFHRQNKEVLSLLHSVKYSLGYTAQRVQNHNVISNNKKFGQHL